MTTHQLRSNTLSTKAFQWLQGLYTAVDGMNHEGFATFLADDAQLQFANNPIAQKEEVVLAGIDQFWSSIHGLNHHFLNVLGTDQQIVLEALIDYKRKDDGTAQVPCVTILERNEKGEVQNMRIFLDLTPVMAARPQV